MATTRAVLTPLSAEFPTTNFPQLVVVNARPFLGFDTTTGESCTWTLVGPQGLTGTMTAVVTYVMASATTGGVAWDVSVEAITDGDATDIDAGDSFDTKNTGTATVPATAGHIDQVSVTLTNQDSIAVADLVRIKVARDPANASDTATGDAYLVAVELRDAA